jgi:hypothetical protein
MKLKYRIIEMNNGKFIPQWKQFLFWNEFFGGYTDETIVCNSLEHAKSIIENDRKHEDDEKIKRIITKW